MEKSNFIVMRITSAVTAMLIFWSATSYTSSPGKISVSCLPDNSVAAAVDPEVHERYGAAYPLTYKIALPAGSANLAADRRYGANESWYRITERTADMFFNGEEAVRFDYANSMALVSVPFSSSSDSLSLRVTDGAGKNVAVAYAGIAKYYDDRKAAVVVSADDWHPSFNQYFLFALSIFRHYRLWVSAAIVTEWCDAQTWGDIQSELDSGYVEAASHGRNHIHTPYPDPAYEVSGSKADIMSNLVLPDPFSSGQHQYVYVWIAPYSDYDDAIDSLVSLNRYLVSRLVQFDETMFSSWNGVRNMYNGVGETREMGPLWGGSNDLADLNQAFDAAIGSGGVYHVMCHPHVLAQYDEWSKPYTSGHLEYISNRRELWYASMGQAYLYHFMQDEAAVPQSVPLVAGGLPERVQLRQNYPNPFNPSTTIDYQVSRAGAVRLHIYNVAGQLLVTLVDGFQGPGYYRVHWDAPGMPSGTYFYRLQAEGEVHTNRMVLVR